MVLARLSGVAAGLMLSRQDNEAFKPALGILGGKNTEELADEFFSSKQKADRLNTSDLATHSRSLT
jgi:hypothetical protein